MLQDEREHWIVKRGWIETSNTSDSFFEELAHIPSDVVQPKDVYNVLARRTDEKFHDKLPLLTQLSFATIASL